MAFKQDLSCFSFTCSTQPEELTNRLKHSNKILLPPSILYSLNEEKQLENNDIMFFKVINKELNFGQVCGVHEFSAPPAICHVPYHVMENLAITQGDTIEIEKVSPVNGTFMKLRPHKTEFINLSNPKVVLEKIVSADYPVVTKGQTIEIFYKELNKIFHIDIIETEPAEIISIVNTDINVDFDKPLDYVEPKKPSPPSPQTPSPQTPSPQNKIINRRAQIENMQSKTTKQFVPFSGQGYRLGSK